MGSKFEVRAVYLKLNYFDNRVDNEFQPLDYGVGNGNASTIQQILKTKGILPYCRLKLDSIEEGGTILLPIDFDPNAYNTIVLVDKRSNWAYAYFLADTGRVFNELVEYKLTLNYYATYGEDFLFGNSTRKLWHKMNVYKSNQIPIPSTSYDSTRNGLTNPDVQKWSWMNASVSELPENLKIDQNNDKLVQYIYNIFNATYVPTNSLFKNASVSNVVRDVNTNTNRYLRVKSFNLNLQGQTIDLDVIWVANYNPNVQHEVLRDMGAGNYMYVFPNPLSDVDVKYKIEKAIRDAWDTDTYILLSITGSVMQGSQDILAWDGEVAGHAENEPYTQGTVTVAVPVSKENLYTNYSFVGLLKERFGGIKIGFLGITKLKSQNWFRNQKPKSVMILTPLDFRCGEGGNRDNGLMICPILSTISVRTRYQIPRQYANFGWYHRVYSQIQTNNWTWTSVPKTMDAAIGTMKVCSGFTRIILNTGNSWIIHDWTKFNSKNFDTFYTNLGYEMMWIEPNFHLNDPYYMNQLWPWKENKMSLGYNAINERNAGQFGSKLIDTIQSNAKQWEVARNQAQYNFNNTLVQTPFKMLGNLVNISGLINNVANIENARFDLQKMGAVKQDLRNSNVGSYPAGNSWLFDWEVPSIWVVEWDTRFAVNVYNYVTRNGWYNYIQGWNRSYLNQNSASAVFGDVNGGYNIAGYIAFAQFYRDLNQMVRNVSVIAREKGIFVPHTVKEWFADWFDKGVRIYYQPDEAVRSKTWTLAEVEAMAKTTAEVKCDANKKEDVICAKERQSIANQQESASENIQGDVERAGKSRTKTEARSKSRARTSSRKSQANN